MLKPLSIISIIACLLSIWVYYDKSSYSLTFKQVNTSSYLSLVNDTSSVDRLFNEFDPRRYPINILRYIDESSELEVPFTWEDAVDITNKTSLGSYWMSLYEIKEICLMNGDQIFHYLSFNGSNFEVYSMFHSYNSIKRSINNWFNKQPATPEFEIRYKTISLSTSDFQLNYTEYLNTLSIPQKHSLKSQENFTEFRYFKEASLLSPNISNGLSHYDLRFFHSRIKPIDRISILHRVVRSWARFTNSHNITTWLGHGSLMGYFFNGLILPWDDDLDVQVSAKSFWDLVKLNQTIVIDYQDYEVSGDIGMYLIDINPFFHKRLRNPENKIDARFIDIRSGLYIDITVLTNDVNDMNILQSLKGSQSLEFHKIFDPQYDQIVTETEVHQSQIMETINNTAESQSLISCKDYHFYTAEELSPLIPSVFEGEVVYVPNHIESLLLREYGRKSLYLMDFLEFEFDRVMNLWKSKIHEYEINFGILEFVQFHYSSLKSTNTYFKRHIWDLEALVKFDSFRVDPWIRDKLSFVDQ